MCGISLRLRVLEDGANTNVVVISDYTENTAACPNLILRSFLKENGVI